MESFQCALNRNLLLESEKGKMYFAFDTTELLKGDMLKRYQAYQIALQANFMQIDEVRYKEDLPKLGFNYVKLGLQDVLLDVKSGTVYTPNTNQTAKIGSEVLKSGVDSGIIDEEDEKRFNPYHDPTNGRFTSGAGGGKIKSITVNDDGSVTTVYKEGKPQNNPHKGNTVKNGIVYDSDGKAFDYPECRLETKEYKKVVSEINTLYDTRYKGKTKAWHYSENYSYAFEIHGYDKYNIYDKNSIE